MKKYILFISLFMGILNGADNAVVNKKHPAETPVKGFCGFKHLPTEVAISIFKHLPPQEISTISRTNKKLKNYTSDNRFVKDFLGQKSKKRLKQKQIDNALNLPFQLFCNWYNSLEKKEKSAVTARLQALLKRPSSDVLNKVHRLFVAQEDEKKNWFENKQSFLPVFEASSALFSKSIKEEQPQSALAFLQTGIQPTDQNYKNLCDFYTNKIQQAKNEFEEIVSLHNFGGNKSLKNTQKKYYTTMAPYFDLLNRITTTFETPKEYKKTMKTFLKTSKKSKEKLQKSDKK